MIDCTPFFEVCNPLSTALRLFVPNLSFTTLAPLPLGGVHPAANSACKRTKHARRSVPAHSGGVYGFFLDFGLWPKCTRLCIQHKNAILEFFHVAKNGDGQKNHAKRMGSLRDNTSRKTAPFVGCGGFSTSSKNLHTPRQSGWRRNRQRASSHASA